MTVTTPFRPYLANILFNVVSFSGIVIVKNQCMTLRSFRIFQNISGFDHYQCFGNCSLPTTFTHLFFRYFYLILFNPVDKGMAWNS